MKRVVAAKADSVLLGLEEFDQGCRVTIQRRQDQAGGSPAGLHGSQALTHHTVEQRRHANPLCHSVVEVKIGEER
jgi:hypothetical protein